MKGNGKYSKANILRMKSLKYYVATVLSELYYPIFKYKKYNIMSISETIDYMSKPGNCIVRFGDGEFMIMSNKSIDLQERNVQLSSMLSDTINELQLENLLICLPEPLRSLKNIKDESKHIWKLNFFLNRKAYSKNCKKKYYYGNAFVSRPYMTYKSKIDADEAFHRLLCLFKDKDILIVEGELSRSGVGNNLFAKAKSVQRIICPAFNAFQEYDRILEVTKKHGKNRLVLVALGPTAKPLVLQLAKQGYWALDIGHLDSEYEWYLSGKKEKTKSRYKHSAENPDEMIEPCNDEEYKQSIISDLVVR